MKHFIFGLLLVLLVSACSSQKLDETLYVKIASEAVCQAEDNDAAVYARYGISTQQMDTFRFSLASDKERSERIGRAILAEVGKCLGGE